jgi:hypothetical protein
MFDITIKDMAGNILCNIKEPDELSLEYLGVIIKNKCNIQDSFMLLYKDGTPLCVHKHIYRGYDIAEPKHVNIFRYYIICDGITELTLVKSPKVYDGTNIPYYNTYGFMLEVTKYTPHSILERFNLDILNRLFGLSDSILKDYVQYSSKDRIYLGHVHKYWSFYKITKYFYNKMDTFIWDNIHINYIHILDEYGNLTIHNLNAIIQDLLKDLPEYFGINVCKPNGYLKILTLTQLQEYFQYEKKHIDIDDKSPAIFR